MSVNTAHKALRRAMWKYAERAMYQCSHCGRLILNRSAGELSMDGAVS
jgi:hypothetical protein